MKIYSLLIGMIIASNALAMEGSKKKHRGEEYPEFGGLEPMEMGAEEELQVKLISSEGKGFVLPISAAQLSGSLAALLEYPELGIEHGLEFKLREVSTFNLSIIIPLLIKLDQLRQHNEQADITNQIYIPHAFQPDVNAQLMDLSDSQIGDLYKVVDFLDIPFMVNSIASIIADRVSNKVARTWPNMSLSERKAEVANLVERFGIAAAQNQDYILRHVQFRMKGISQEYSIADYIREHDEPELIIKNGLNQLQLLQSNITSLFGINLITQKDRIESLEIGLNYLGDLSLDLQLPLQPLSEFVNLQHLDLSHNQLNNLPEHLFAGLVNLRKLNLSNNQLNNLPERIFAGLVNLQELGLHVNQLNNLPERVFAGLVNLQILLLAYNQLNHLPERIFAGLVNLQHLGLSYNQLNNLPEHIFAGLIQLRTLGLYDNQLNNLPKQVFAGPVNLQKLFLSGNQLNEQDKQNIREMLLRTEINFGE